MSEKNEGMMPNPTERVAKELARQDHGDQWQKLWDGYESQRMYYTGRATELLALIDGEPVAHDEVEPVGRVKDIDEAGEFTVLMSGPVQEPEIGDLVYLHPPEPRKVTVERCINCDATIRHEPKEPVGWNRKPDAMCHASYWKDLLVGYESLTVCPYDAAKIESAHEQGREGPPWPVWIGNPPPEPSREREAMDVLRERKGQLRHTADPHDGHRYGWVYLTGDWTYKSAVEADPVAAILGGERDE